MAPFCDTTMHFFDEGELKVVKFYLNPEEDVVDETEDRGIQANVYITANGRSCILPDDACFPHDVHK